MTHMITSTGLDYHLTGTSAFAKDGRKVTIEDIAHHLAIINRFTGATSRPYSVAEHSLLCSEITERVGASPIVQLAALMHDAHEAYTNDLSSPAKIAVNRHSTMGGGVQAWNLFEMEHAKIVRAHFGLLTVFSNNRLFLREVDLQALATERRDLTRYNPERHTPWAVLGDDTPTPLQGVHWAKLNTTEREQKTWRDWRDGFHARFEELRALVQLKAQRIDLTDRVA